MKFRKKPAVIDADLVTEDLFEGPNDKHIIGFVYDPIKKCVLIPTLEGLMTAQLGDWIIRGVKGEYYPCKPDIFEATYERVETN